MSQTGRANRLAIATSMSQAKTEAEQDINGPDVPAKYRGRKSQDGDQLVGTRIDPSTPLGKELADLRRTYMMAGRAKAEGIMRDHPDQARIIAERSLNIPIPDNASKQYYDQRRQIIRNYVQNTIREVVAVHGRPPTSLIMKAEVIDEVRTYCADMDVVFQVEKA